MYPDNSRKKEKYKWEDKIMDKKDYILQYAMPHNSKELAVSDWKEKITTIKAGSTKEAIQKFRMKNQKHLGVWIVLDCYEK